MRLLPLLLLTVACGAEDDELGGFEFSAIEIEVHELVNSYRVEQGLLPLEASEIIGEVSRAHSQDMLDGRVAFGHDGFDERVDAVMEEMALVFAAENVAYTEGYGDAASVAVEGWINSPGHQQNMVGDFDLGGVGVARSEDGRTLYFTHIFALTP